MMKTGTVVKFLLVSVLSLGLTHSAWAVLGLPYADDATTDAGTMRIGGGVTLESDVNLYGARFTYGAMDGVAIFGGGGIIDPDFADSEPFFQVGAQYQLPLYDLPFEVAIRGAFGITSWEDSWTDFWGRGKIEVDLWTLNVGALGSKKLDEVPLTIYGFLGLSYQKFEVDVTVTGPDGRESFSDSDSETEPAIAAGAIYSLNDNVSFYGEVAHIDELFFSLGARYQF